MIESARRISQWGILLETVGRVWLCSRFPAGTGNLNELKNYNGVTKFAKMERSVWSIIIYVYEIIVCINNVISRVQRNSARGSFVVVAQLAERSTKGPQFKTIVNLLCANIFFFWANFHSSKWPNIEQIT